MDNQPIGIIGAMREEVAGVIDLLNNRREKKIGGRVYYCGDYNDHQMVVTLSKWGKVSAAATVSALILEFDVKEVIFTGVAGAVNTGLRVGDIVIGKRTVQYDMDARPLLPQYEIPSLKTIFMECDPTLLAISSGAIQKLIEIKAFEKEDFKKLNIETPRLFIGDIASSDRFFSNQEDKDQLHRDLPSILCVEMEGSAVAQVCEEYQIPWIVIRTISDNADESSSIDFNVFIERIASMYSTEIIKKILKMKDGD